MPCRLKYLIIFTAICIACISLPSENAFAKPDEDFIVRLVQEKVQMIEGWESNANFIMSLLVAVGALGIVTGVLQTVQARWTKTATMIVGALVSILMVIHTTVFDVDHRVLKRKAHEGRKLIQDARQTLDQIEKGNYNTDNKEDLRSLTKEIFDLIKKIDKLADDFYVTAALSGLVSDAYAAPATANRPDWVETLPQSSRFRYYVGEGVGETVRDAEKKALSSGREKILRDLLSIWRETTTEPVPDRDDLGYLMWDLHDWPDRRHVEYNRETGTYTYYSLFRVNGEQLFRVVQFDLLSRGLQ